MVTREDARPHGGGAHHGRTQSSERALSHGKLPVAELGGRGARGGGSEGDRGRKEPALHSCGCGKALARPGKPCSASEGDLGELQTYTADSWATTERSKNKYDCYTKKGGKMDS